MYLGCENWYDFAARAGLAMDEPRRVLFAEVRPTGHRPGASINGLWQEGDRYRWFTTSVFEGESATDLEDLREHLEHSFVEADDLHARLLQWVIADRLAVEGLGNVEQTDPRLIAAMWQAVRYLGAERLKEGVRTLFTVQASGGSFDEDWTLVTACYEDLDTAIAHAKAAKRKSDGKGGEDAEFVHYGVGFIPFRRSLPAEFG